MIAARPDLLVIGALTIDRFGDIFAAFMLVEPWPRPVPAGGFLRQRAESAMLAVAEILEGRRGQAP